MLTRQRSLDGLHDPAVLRLLRSSLPAYVTCTGDDGARRIVRAPFHWNGTDLVLRPNRYALALPVFPDGAEISLSIDSDAPPWTVLQVHGSAWVEAGIGGVPVVRVRPTWVGVLGFQAAAAD